MSEHDAPRAGELTSGAKATHDQILEWLNLQDAQFRRLGAGSNSTDAGGDVAMPPPAPKQHAKEERSAAAAVAAARAKAARPAQPTAPEIIPR